MTNVAYKEAAYLFQPAPIPDAADRDVNTASQFPGIEGLNIPFPQRAPDNVDEAARAIKYTLGKIESRRSALLAASVDAAKLSGVALETTGLPDPYEPLRALIDRLLPHLRFERIDFSNEENIRCIFARSDGVSSVELDLDDLSSGEKAIILLFLPLIEHEITHFLTKLEARVDSSIEEQPLPTRVFIVDEPEQHLHPELQTESLHTFAMRRRERVPSSWWPRIRPLSWSRHSTTSCTCCSRPRKAGAIGSSELPRAPTDWLPCENLSAARIS